MLEQWDEELDPRRGTGEWGEVVTGKPLGSVPSCMRPKLGLVSDSARGR